MNRVDDIFAEPDPIDPDALANMSPLRCLAGVWTGDSGGDVTP